MKPFFKRLDYAGFNPQLMLLVAGWTFLVFHLIFPLVDGDAAFGIAHHYNGIQCDLDRLGRFHFDEMNGTIENIPSKIRELDGKTVSMDGFIRSPIGGDQVSSFTFVYDLPHHDGAGPLVQQRLYVSVRDHQTVDDVQEEVRVTGTLHINIERDPDTHEVIRIFSMDLDRIEQL